MNVNRSNLGYGSMKKTEPRPKVLRETKQFFNRKGEKSKSSELKTHIESVA